MIAEYFLWIKALHVISMVAWMAGLFYLPRLFAYHAEAEAGSDKAKTFEVMEKRLLKIIMNPAMILTFVFGILMLTVLPMNQGWIHAKLFLVFILAGFHGYLAVTRKNFINNKNIKTAKFYKIINEIPTVLLIIIVVLAVVKPF